MDINELISKALELGVHEAAVIDADKVPFDPEVPKMCAVNRCGQYGKTWNCPPGVGTFDECKERCLKYKKAFVFSTKHDLEDSFDIEGMADGKKKHQEISEKVRNLFFEEFKDILVLSSEGCDNCEKCTYPDAPCRFPERSFPSVESYGIMVYKEAAVGGIKYINGANTVTYFGNIFFND